MMIFLGGPSFSHFCADSCSITRCLTSSSGRSRGNSSLNLSLTLNETGYSNTSFALTSTKFKENFYETGSDIQLLENRSHEKTYKFRNSNHIILSKKISMDLGLDAKFYRMRYDNLYQGTLDVMGQPIESVQLNERMSASQWGPFINLTLKPLQRLKAMIGVRSDYFSLSRKHVLSSSRPECARALLFQLPMSGVS